MHVTPEPDFSYASFETNLDVQSYEALIHYVLGVFNPKRFTITTFFDMEEAKFKAGMMRAGDRHNPLDQMMYTARNSKRKYRRCLKTESQFLGEFIGGIGNWRLVDDVKVRTPKTRVANRTADTQSSPALL